MRLLEEEEERLRRLEEEKERLRLLEEEKERLKLLEEEKERLRLLEEEEKRLRLLGEEMEKLRLEEKKQEEAKEIQKEKPKQKKQEARRLWELVEMDMEARGFPRTPNSVETYDVIEIETYPEAGPMPAPGSSGSVDSGYRGLESVSERGRMGAESAV